MEEQGKRLLIAVVLALGLMLAWNYFFPPAPPKPAPPANAAEPNKPVPPPAAPGAPGATPPSQPSQNDKPRAAEQLVRFDLPEFQVAFSTYGGSIRSWALADAQFRDPTTRQPRPLIPAAGEELGGALSLSFAEAPETLPLDAEWLVFAKTDRGVSFAWEDATLRVEKIFELVPKEYRVNLKVRIKNLSAVPAKQSLAVSVFGFQDPNADTGGGLGRMPQFWGSACLGAEMTRVSIGDLVEDGPSSAVGARWAGMVHSYFLVAVAPDSSEEPVKERIGCTLRAVGKNSGGMRAEVTYPLAAVAPGEIYERDLTAYLGPMFLDDLEQISAQLRFKPGLEEAVDLGFFAILARPLLWLLKWFQSFVINWGIAIILLTITVKLATLYWTTKSMRSMQEMARLRPQLERIKEKYKDDKQRQQVETMNLFKAHSVNPVAGCLPMLLQMPVWFALYKSLNVAAELHHAPFVQGWISDLTAPDPFFILPVAMTIMMFLQSKLTPQTATGAQQKMLQYGMPLMFGVFSLFFPAGLTLYIFTNTLLSAAHSLYMHRGSRAAVSVPVAAEPAAATPANPKTNDKPPAHKKGKKRKNRS